MSKHRDIDKFADFLAKAMDARAQRKLASGEYDNPESGSMGPLMRCIRREYADGKLKSRIRRYVNRSPLTMVKASVVGAEIERQIANEIVDEIVGNFDHVPEGMEEGEMWLTPGSEMQKMMLERKGDDAIMVIMAKRLDDGRLEPAVFWTENEEIIADAQKGHRKYMALRAREDDGTHRSSR